jgi:hypothetical protein
MLIFFLYTLSHSKGLQALKKINWPQSENRAHSKKMAEKKIKMPVELRNRITGSPPENETRIGIAVIFLWSIR